MRNSKRLVAGTTLALIALACLLLNNTTKATSANTSQRQSRTNAAINATLAPLQTNWRVAEPVVYENLAVFPVTSDAPATTDDFITLDEGLRAGTVTVTELGADTLPQRTIEPRPSPQSNRIPQQANRIPQQRGDSAQVNKLALTNKSGKKLVLIAGEMVVGGKQDRIVGNDEIIPSSDEPVAINVFCVEHGRWSGGAAFAKSSAGSAVSEKRMMASPKVRANAQAKKDQSEVWKGVAEQVSANGVSTSTGDLKSVYEDKRVSRTLENYESAFKEKVPGKEVIGVVVAVSGRIVSADVFASPKLFEAYWPKMLRSYALEAISSKKDLVKASVKDAEAFLARANGGSKSSGREGVFRLTEHQSDADASFELEGEAKSSKVLVHFNRVSKK